jgi:hypothetical protein
MLSKIPISILLKITGENKRVALHLVLALPKLGRFSLNFQPQIQKIFLERTVGKHGTVLYELNGKLHRLEGPAVEWPDGYKAWFKFGFRHRLEGPAVEWPSGAREWFENGRFRRKEEGKAKFNFPLP